MLLLLEYLHAHAGWYAEAPTSLRAEGRAMLMAVAEDLVSAKIPATVALCPEATADIRVNLPVIESTGKTACEIASELSAGQQVSDVFPIAPECDGILAELVATFRTAGKKVHTVSNADIECFSDKWTTFQFLTRHSIATIPTFRIDDWHAESHTENKTWITKPRDGLSCDGVQCCPTDEIRRLITLGEIDTATHVIQPFTEGASFSRAFLKREQETLPLPLVRQSIAWNESQPKYNGGTVLGTNDIAPVAAKLADLVIQQLPTFSGYLGVDFIVDADTGHVSITEINPRLCSSYIGYRKATSTNLMTWLLQPDYEAPEWRSSDIAF